MSPNRRLLGLDILRLVAVALVLVCHVQMEAGSPEWLRPLLCLGGMGVDLFFVLSGFLVSGLLFAEYKTHGSLRIRRFYARRAWKIYPAFYLMLVVTYCYTRFVLGIKIHDRVIFRELLFLQNYAPGYWNHTWSLAIEEHFYVVLPLVLGALAAMGRRANPFRAVPWLVAASAVAVFAARVVNLQLHPEPGHHIHDFPTHLRVDALFFGVAIAYFYHFRNFADLHRWRIALVFAGPAALACMPLIARHSHALYHTVGFTWEYLACGCVLAGVLLCDIPSNAVTRRLAQLGSYSYSIYLWHMASHYWVTPHVASAPWIVRAAVFVACALVVGVAMSKLWELPMLALRDRLSPATASPIAPPPLRAATPQAADPPTTIPFPQPAAHGARRRRAA